MFGERVISPRMIVPAVLVHIALIWAAFATWFTTPELPKPREPFVVTLDDSPPATTIEIAEPTPPEPIVEPEPIVKPVPHEFDVPIEAKPPTQTTTASIAPVIGPTITEGSQTATTAVLVGRVAPVYPRRAILQSKEGNVTLSIIVGADGRVKDVQVVDANPEGYFERAAIEAVSQWKYEPLMVNGVAVERAGLKVIVNFNLKD